MAHNTKGEVVLHPADEATLDKAARIALGKGKRHLSYFERQTALALGKSLDGNHIDLNENANTTSYTGSGRQNPNARVSDGFENATHRGVDNTKAQKAARVAAKSKCAQNCIKAGRVNCLYCGGVGYANTQTRDHASRNLMPGQTE